MAVQGDVRCSSLCPGPNSSGATGTSFFSRSLSPRQVKVLTDDARAIYAQHCPENVRERTGDVVRNYNCSGYVAHRDFMRVESLPEDFLLLDYDVLLPDWDGALLEVWSGLLEAA